ncbi:MAG: DUF4065 domain-containing protein [Syntrophomonadaceae bacterium]|nr:DUF4065 domain-containing protein [Syntrophomonadaceae bacterium]
MDYCVECLENSNFSPVQKNKVFDIKGESIEIMTTRYQCSCCGAIIPDPYLEERYFEEAYCEYRKRKGLLQPNEIVHIREMYGLSQRQFAKLLGWSHATISRYESGALQSPSHNAELIMLKKPENMKGLLESSSNQLSQKEIKLLENKIDCLLGSKEDKVYRLIEDLFIDEPSINNGFTIFNLDKMVQTVKYLACKDFRLPKVKLMKYLWYIDFVHFKRYSNSVNGIKYAALPLGPVPDKYEFLMGLIENETDHILKEYEDVGLENPAELYKPIGELNLSLFSKEEIETIDFVSDLFKDETSTSISRKSHSEKAWSITSIGYLISYQYAQELSIG